MGSVGISEGRNVGGQNSERTVMEYREKKEELVTDGTMEEENKKHWNLKKEKLERRKHERWKLDVKNS